MFPHALPPPLTPLRFITFRLTPSRPLLFCSVPSAAAPLRLNPFLIPQITALDHPLGLPSAPWPYAPRPLLPLPCRLAPPLFSLPAFHIYTCNTRDGTAKVLTTCRIQAYSCAGYTGRLQGGSSERKQQTIDSMRARARFCVCLTRACTCRGGVSGYSVVTWHTGAACGVSQY